MKLLAILLSIACLTACTSVSQLDDPAIIFKGQSAAQIEQKADLFFKKKNYTAAIKAYEAINILHPFTRYAEQAQFQLAWAYYHHEDMPAAVTAAERFIRLYPRNSRVESAYYLKALANFSQDRSWYMRYAKVDIARRDPGSMRQAQEDFLDFIQRFPNSSYIPDVQQKLAMLRQLFANYELRIVEYYFDKKAWVAVMNRTNELIKSYPDTPAAHRAQEIQEIARRALAV